MLTSEYVETLQERPRCPLCSRVMVPNHARVRVDQTWQYTAIRFECRGSPSRPPHSASIWARTPEEWEQHLRRVSFINLPDRSAVGELK